MSVYPEHEKLRAKEVEALVLSGFYDWLQEQGIVLAKFHQTVGGYEDWTLSPIYDRPDELFGRFLNIDPKKLNEEKEAMYRELRKRVSGDLEL